MILMEYMTTSLRKQLEIDEYFPPKLVKYLSIDISLALNYLHLIQPNPISIVTSAVLMFSYNLLYSQDSGRPKSLTTVLLILFNPGSPAYSAPEASIPSQQSPKMDIYSFGVLLWRC